MRANNPFPIAHAISSRAAGMSRLATTSCWWYLAGRLRNPHGEARPRRGGGPSDENLATDHVSQ
eukprot:7210072-Lingulodinium_polyedra.AAC.1